MPFGRHVFISYAHLDNEGGASPGWINRFHTSLSGILSQRMGVEANIWRDERLKPNDVFADEIVQQLPDTAVMIAVISPRYVQSKWCLKEAATFCEVAQQPPGLVVDNKSRVFKIVKTPTASQDTLPAAMRGTLGVDFYVRVKADMTESKDESDAPLELDASYGEHFERMFNTSVARLAWDIYQTLQRLEKSAVASTTPALASTASAARPPRPDVYLAECAYDRRKDREDLKSELLMRGYAVLPEYPLPQDEDGYRSEVGRLLERCALSIHLVGAAAGALSDGPKQVSVVAIQNELAAERARASTLRRVISIPAGTSTNDTVHAALLEALHRDPNQQFGADVITADLQAVKAAVNAALARLEAPAATAPVESTGAPMVYAIFDERDRKATVPLRKALAARGVSVQIPVFEGDAAEVRTANQERLTQCDAVLVFYGAGTEAWKASVDSDVRRAAALRQGRPLHGVFTWLAEPSTAAKTDAIDMAEPGLIDGLQGFSDGLVEPIVAAITGLARG